MDGKQDFRKYEMGKGRNIGGASVFYFMHAENILKHVSVCVYDLCRNYFMKIQNYERRSFDRLCYTT